MRIFTRGLVLVLSIVSSAVAVAVAFVAWRGGEWGARSDLLEAGLRIDGTAETRVLVAIAAGGVALMIAVVGVAVAFARRRTVTLWLGGQHPVQVPASIVERFLQTVVDDMKGVEAVRVTARSAGKGTTALGVEWTVAPDSDATLVASRAASARCSCPRPPSCSVGARRSRFGTAMPSLRDSSGRQAA